MSRVATIATQSLVTFALCAGCWWVWSSSFSLAALFQIAEFDLVVRILEMFALLSVFDLANERLWPLA